MYVPLAKKEQEAINALMYLYKRVYQMIGVFVLALGVIVSVFLPVLIPDAACSAAALRFYFTSVLQERFLPIIYHISGHCWWQTKSHTLQCWLTR